MSGAISQTDIDLLLLGPSRSFHTMVQSERVDEDAFIAARLNGDSSYADRQKSHAMWLQMVSSQLASIYGMYEALKDEEEKRKERKEKRDREEKERLEKQKQGNTSAEPAQSGTEVGLSTGTLEV